MKQDEKIISILQQDIELPDTVTRKADEAFRQILAENKKEIVHMDRDGKKEFRNKRRVMGRRTWVAAAAAAVVLVVGGCVAKPELAAKIFAMLQDKVNYSGDYSEYAVPVESQAGNQTDKTGTASSSAYTKTVNGVKVTVSEVYCNQEALNISLVIEGKEAFRDKIMTDQFGKQQLFLDLENTFSFRSDAYAAYGNLEGSFIDERTFAGIWRLDLADVLTDSTAIDQMVSDAQAEGRVFMITEEILNQYGSTIPLPEQFNLTVRMNKIIGDLAEQPVIDWGKSEKELEALSDEEFNQLAKEISGKYGTDKYPNSMQNYWMDGPWEFTLPVEVNKADNKTIAVNDINSEGIGLESVVVTPFEMRLNMIFRNHDGADYFPVVLDAAGKWMDPSSGDVSSLPVAGHDISSVTVYLCGYQNYMDEIKGNRDQDNFRQILEEQSVYSKEITLQ